MWQVTPTLQWGQLLICVYTIYGSKFLQLVCTQVTDHARCMHDFNSNFQPSTEKATDPGISKIHLRSRLLFRCIFSLHLRFHIYNYYPAGARTFSLEHLKFKGFEIMVLPWFPHWVYVEASSPLEVQWSLSVTTVTSHPSLVTSAHVYSQSRPHPNTPWPNPNLSQAFPIHL